MSRGYLKGRQAFPLELEAGPKSLSDTMFQYMKDMEETTPPLTSAPMPK